MRIYSIPTNEALGEYFQGDKPEEEIFGEPIFTYTRQQAIDDGVFIDVTETAREAGFRCSVAVTTALWHEWINPDPMPEGQDMQGRLWDVLMIAFFKVKAYVKGLTERPKYEELLTGAKVRFYTGHGTYRNIDIWIAVGADETGPYVTILLPSDY